VCHLCKQPYLHVEVGHYSASARISKGQGYQGFLQNKLMICKLVDSYNVSDAASTSVNKNFNKISIKYWQKNGNCVVQGKISEFHYNFNKMFSLKF
jgi:hypothetical protein